MINVLQYALYEGWNAVKAGRCTVHRVNRGNRENRGNIGNREMGYTEGGRGRYNTGIEGLQHRTLLGLFIYGCRTVFLEQCLRSTQLRAFPPLVPLCATIPGDVQWRE